MDHQGRVCANCMKFDAAATKCRITQEGVNIAQPNTAWCWEGLWAWWDKVNGRWQACFRHNDSTDMGDRLKPPINRATITTMITNVPAGYKVTFDGRIIPEEEAEY